MKKRIVSILLCFACLLTLCGCSRQETEPTPSFTMTQEMPSVRETQSASPWIAQSLSHQKTQKAPTLPPAMDEAFSHLVFRKLSQSTNGNTSMVYDGCANGDQVISTIEDYIALLEDYGYTLVRSDVFAGCYYAYWLESNDTSLETLNYRQQACHLAIEGAIDADYGWKDIFVYYSPSILGYYTGDTPTTPTEDDDDHWDHDDDNDSRTKIRCSKCHGDGEMTCTNCSGAGYKEKQVSTPNYSGKGARYKTVRENCFKCRGNGTVTCIRCGGAGQHS